LVLAVPTVSLHQGMQPQSANRLSTMSMASDAMPPPSGGGVKLAPYVKASNDTSVQARAGAMSQDNVKPTFCSNMANYDAHDLVSKLSLSKTQELTIDSRTVGLDGSDQMDIASIVTRPAYLSQFIWTTTNAVDTLLWNSLVTPNLYRVNDPAIYPTPMSMIANLFRRWQGTIKFRFQIAKSAFHKGRLLIRWDPNKFTQDVKYNSSYCRIVDIAEEDDFEVEIGWGQIRPFLYSKGFEVGDNSFGTNRIETTNNYLSNGVLEVVVLNPLVSPSADSNVKLNVFVSMCPDAKFGEPTHDYYRDISLFPPPLALLRHSEMTPQSGAMSTVAVENAPSEAKETPTIAPIKQIGGRVMDVFFGESIISLREIFRRYVHGKTYVLIPSPTNVLHHMLSLPALPPAYGYDPYGADVVSGRNCNVCTSSPLTIVMASYAGWRGSMRKKLLVSGGHRYPLVTRRAYGQHEASTREVPSPWERNINKGYGIDSFSGAIAQDIENNGVFEIDIPYYEGRRFSSARDPDSGVPREGVLFESLTNAVSATFPNSIKVTEYCAIGDDFSLFFFTGCPIIYKYTI